MCSGHSPLKRKDWGKFRSIRLHHCSPQYQTKYAPQKQGVHSEKSPRVFFKFGNNLRPHPPLPCKTADAKSEESIPRRKNSSPSSLAGRVSREDPWTGTENSDYHGHRNTDRHPQQGWTSNSVGVQTPWRKGHRISNGHPEGKSFQKIFSFVRRRRREMLRLWQWSLHLSRSFGISESAPINGRSLGMFRKVSVIGYETRFGNICSKIVYMISYKFSKIYYATHCVNNLIPVQ